MSNNKELTSTLLSIVFPQEFIDNFEIVDIQKDELLGVLHIYMDEFNILPKEYVGLDLSPNGFYPASCINDFPLRDKKVIIHIRRRRWIDKTGKSYSSHWELTAEGTRYSKEFAAFLKEAFGYDPNTNKNA